MIDTTKETVLALADTPAFIPKRRGGKIATQQTIYRWAKTGCRGVLLETVQVGGTKCTSREALDRFFQRLTDKANAGVGAAT